MLRENTRLVRRMMQIRNSPGQLNPRLLGLRSPRASLSLNFPRRMREYSSLLAGNKVRQRGRDRRERDGRKGLAHPLKQFMEKMIRDVKPTYASAKQLADFRRAESYSASIRHSNSKPPTQRQRGSRSAPSSSRRRPRHSPSPCPRACRA